MQSAHKQKIGILGGSFDPVHSGHIAMARAALEERDLQSVVFLPAAQNPLKTSRPQAKDSDRLAMLKLALAPYPAFSIDTREMQAQGPSYTVDTLSALRKEFGEDVELYWIMGSDSLERLHEWKDVQGLVEMLDGFIIFKRKHEEPVMPQALLDKLESAQLAKIIQGYSNAEIPSVSASEIRGRVGRGENLLGLVTEEVEAYVKERGLYGKVAAKK